MGSPLEPGFVYESRTANGYLANVVWERVARTDGPEEGVPA